jgi:hypothetical protein
VTQRDEAEYWENLLDEQRRTGLKSIRDTAGKWQGTIAGLLGAFGLVAVVKGPSTFKDLGVGESTSAWLLGAMVVAAVLAFGAILCSALAAQGVPHIRSYWTGDNLKSWTHDTIKSTVRLLSVGRWLTYITAVIVFVTWLLVPAIAITQAKPPVLKAIVIRASGQVVCGALTRSASLQVKVGEQPPIDLTSTDDIKIVDRCPD